MQVRHALPGHSFTTAQICDADVKALHNVPVQDVNGS